MIKRVVLLAALAAGALTLDASAQQAPAARTGHASLIGIDTYQPEGLIVGKCPVERVLLELWSLPVNSQ